MEHYYSLNRYLKEKYGTKVYKIALDGGMTCPNRDGTCGTRGCIFCSNGGSGEFAEKRANSVLEQIDKAILRVQQKCKNGKYIAYFQSFTNTYASVDYLKEIFEEAISHKDIVGLSIGTRPDCLPEDVLNLLSQLNQIKPVMVELGLQSSNEKTGQYIRRGYSCDVYEQAVKNLHACHIEVVTHLIMGLPYETREDMLNSVRYVGKCHTDGVKLQLLQVLKGTDLAKEYEERKFEVLSKEEYIDILGEAIELLPSNIVIHRITGDPDKKLLIAPLYAANKKDMLNSISKSFDKRNIKQGSKE